MAVNEGGFRETVLNDKIGLVVGANRYYLVRAIKHISKDPSVYREACMKRAEEFDNSAFLEKICKHTPIT